MMSALVSLAGCDETAEPQPGSAPTGGTVVLLTELDSGQTRSVAVGSIVEVRLTGNPTTGFGWALDRIDGDAVSFVGESYAPDDPIEGRVGSGGTFLMTFRADRPGKATAHLVYRRDWETDVPPADTFTVTLSVE